MKFKTRHDKRLRATASGFTLVEMMTSVGVGLILLGFVAILFINGSLSFQAIGNYQNLDANSTTALDTFSKEIRNATVLLSYTNGVSLVLTNSSASPPTSTTIIYSSTNRTLVMTIRTNGVVQLVKTNLTGCDTWFFSLYNKAPNTSTTNITFNTTTNAAFCKLINMTWKCSRTILGSKLTTESVQTAQVILRNKVQ